MGTSIAGWVAAVVLVGCVGDQAPSPGPTREATPSIDVHVDAITRSFCGHLVAFEQQVARDLDGGTGDVTKVVGRLLNHVSEGFAVLAEEQNRLEGDIVDDADDVLAEIGGVALWGPDDPEPGFADRVVLMVDRIDAFESTHCAPAG